MRLKVRIKGILQDLAAACDIQRVPQPLLMFFNNLCKPKAIIPDNFLTEFEMIRIPSDSYGNMGNIDQTHIKLISSMFVIGKVLLVKILMNPTKMGIPVKFSEKALLNFKILASVLYHNFLEYVEVMTKKILRGKDQPGNDGISTFLLSIRELR
jgi:hypothetical protein